MVEKVTAADNPDLANKLAAEAVKESKKEEKAQIVSPSDNVITLPGGHVTALGEVITEAEVRELNGRDEEAIAKAPNAGKMLNTILVRGTVRVGEEESSETLLDQLLSGDRDYLMLGIYRATFGDETELNAFCSGCDDYKTLQVNVMEDIEVEKINDPIADRRFTVETKKHTYTVVLPSGKTQKELLVNEDKTLAELTTILLAGTVREVDGRPVINRNDVQNIGLADRREIAQAISDKAFGPVFNDVEVECPDCGGKVVAPISIGTLFRF